MKRWDVLEDLIKKHGWTRGAEIGVFAGKTFYHLLNRCQNLTLIGVDHWKWDETPHVQDKEAGVSTSKSAGEMTRYCNEVKAYASLNPRAVVHHMESTEAAKRVPQGSLDFVFIDAEHTTEAVLSDIDAWKPKVKPEGWILGHDEQWPSVRRALVQRFSQWSVYPDNVWSVP